MKIVCDSCAAKYSIADEKVAGRVFKIRCKKCGAAIVVKGESPAAEPATTAGSASFDYGGEAVWHTVVDGEQQGPFAPAQLGSMISAGTMGWDAYVWREGFDDWKPAQDIEELVQAIMNPGGAPAAGGGAADPFEGDNPTIAQSAPSAAKSSAPAKASAKASAGADLFAQSEGSPFGGGGGDEDDVVASAASPRVGANQAMTGARNENSVLFSLSNLQALATGSPGGGSSSSSSAPSRAAGPSGGKTGMAAGEGSGLIDIRALASATGLSGGGGGYSPSPMIGSGPAPKVDDLLSIGSPSVGLGSALAAPVIIAEKSEPARGGGGMMILAAAIVAIAFLGGAGIFAYVSLNAPDPAATTATAAIVAPPPPPTTAVAAPPPTTTVSAAPATTVEAPATTVAAGGGGGSGSRRPRGGGSSPSTGGGGSASADPPPATRASGGGGGGDRSIDDLLSSALGPGTGTRPRGGGGGGASAAPTPAPAAAGPATPGRSDVVSAMNGVQPAVTACGAGEHGVATVSISVSGSSGHVSNASVSGQFAGTPVGSCIARAVRGATFPHFSNPTFTFSYPFRI